MADARTCFKGSDEALSAFNKRLKVECEDFEPTRVIVVMIDGEPCVTLMAETVEANEEDVADAKEHGATITENGKERPIERGDEIPAGDIVQVKLAKIAGFETPKSQAARKGTKSEGLPRSVISEEHLDSLYAEAKGLITEILHVSGPPLPPEYVGHTLHYVAVVFVSVEDAEDAEKDAAEGEAALRG